MYGFNVFIVQSEYDGIFKVNSVFKDAKKNVAGLIWFMYVTGIRERGKV